MLAVPAGRGRLSSGLGRASMSKVPVELLSSLEQAEEAPAVKTLVCRGREQSGALQNYRVSVFFGYCDHCLRETVQALPQKAT